MNLSLGLRITPFTRRIVDAIAQDQDAHAIRDIVRDAIDDDDFPDDPDELDFAAQLTSLLIDLRDRDSASLAGYDEMVEAAFGQSADALVESSDFSAFRDQVSDRLLALKILPIQGQGSLTRYVDLQRAISLLDHIASRDNALERVSPRSLVSATLELPSEIFPLPGSRRERLVPPDDEKEREIAALKEELIELENAAEEVLTLGAADLETSGPVPDMETGRLHDDNHRAPVFVPRSDVEIVSAAPPQNFERDSFVFVRQSSISSLTDQTQRTLTTVGVTATPVGLGEMIDQLERRSTVVEQQIEALTMDPDAARFLTIGGSTIPVNVSPFEIEAAFANPEPLGVPTTVGQIRPTHVGMLRKTKQHILRYEAEEIAHVENVVIGETKTRETRRLRRTEETTIFEEEITQEEERDLQTTDRMELQREAQQTLKQSQQFKIGSSISASYGPVEVTVDTEFATDSSLEAINRTASSYAREVLERTAQRITERVRREEIFKAIEEFEEHNEHGFENTTTEHIAAMFQWLVKVYYAQVFDYGARLWMGVTVPEPQYFLTNTLKKEKGPLADLVEPDPISFSPKHLQPSNYMTYVKKYQVDGVEPPPERKKIVSKVFRYPESSAPQSEPPPEEMNGSLEMGIEHGYKAVEAYVICQRGSPKHGAGPLPDDILSGLTLFIGENFASFLWDQASVIKGNYHLALTNETGSLMIGYSARNIRSYVLGIQVTLLRTERAMNDWRLKTYDAIVARYQAMHAEYRERKAELEAQAGIEIQGRNPMENRILERTELTRSALAMITGQNFEEFDAILGFMEGRIDADEAIPEGRYARFFMNCFEWENMTYEFLPYFWGRRQTWKEKLLLQDVDPLHAEFLKCGYADVQLPVRPGYEAVLMHWLDTGLIWQGEEPPEVTNGTYARFLDQLAELRADENSHIETPFGDPWELTLPTTLVRIRPGNNLPEWEMDEDSGEFVPVPEP
ncbi:MAG: hypothetical protein AAFW87_10830 [Pseudomonadota bacterium]